MLTITLDSLQIVSVSVISLIAISIILAFACDGKNGLRTWCGAASILIGLILMFTAIIGIIAAICKFLSLESD